MHRYLRDYLTCLFLITLLATRNSLPDLVSTSFIARCHKRKAVNSPCVMNGVKSLAGKVRDQMPKLCAGLKTRSGVHAGATRKKTDCGRAQQRAVKPANISLSNLPINDKCVCQGCSRSCDSSRARRGSRPTRNHNLPHHKKVEQ